jgi:hypothetical protein
MSNPWMKGSGIAEVLGRLVFLRPSGAYTWVARSVS